ncbi:MAG: MGH1-like glycoside hydrolase domain-containing protein, partial [Geminicoccaceae bacterium]
PYQWNWDSAFAALGFATFDRERAWLEIETLFEGQWDDGMVPHIVFRRDDPDYFPGPAVWQAGKALPSSGHSQPPVVATVVLELVELGGDADEARARTLFQKILAYHRWFHRFRDPGERGVIGIVHPWESGRDNSADWDDALAGIHVPPDLGDYQRRDTDHIDAEQRPKQAQYDRYLSIVKFGRDAGWNHFEIAKCGPFFVADPGIQFILMRADRDLLTLAKRFDDSAAASEIEGWIARSEAGSNELWNEEVGAFCARNLKTGAFADAITSAAALAFYAGAGSETQRAMLANHLTWIMAHVDYAFPSLDPADPRFEPKRYWRGPVWLVMNYMIGRGLAEAGYEAMAERVKTDTARLIKTSGFSEYFHPMTGEGCGGRDFSWTAAIWLAWAGQSHREKAT